MKEVSGTWHQSETLETLAKIQSFFRIQYQDYSLCVSIDYLKHYIIKHKRIYELRQEHYSPIVA